MGEPNFDGKNFSMAQHDEFLYNYTKMHFIADEGFANDLLKL